MCVWEGSVCEERKIVCQKESNRDNNFTSMTRHLMKPRETYKNIWTIILKLCVSHLPCGLGYPPVGQPRGVTSSKLKRVYS